MEGRRGDDLGADNIALHHHGDGASPRVFAGKLGFNETTVGKVLEKAKAQAQSDLFIDHLTTLDQQAKNGSNNFMVLFITTYANMIPSRGRPVQTWSSSRHAIIYRANPWDK